jgi:hypothetical protein
LTAPATPSTAAERGPRPTRPGLVTAAAGYLIVVGVLGAFASLNFARTLPPGSESALAVTVAIAALSILVAILMLAGRLWFICVSFAALLGLLDLATATSPFGLLLGLADIAVVGVMLARKAWFDEMGRWREAGRKPAVAPPAAADEPGPNIEP